jgi:hypothetical protein
VPRESGTELLRAICIMSMAPRPPRDTRSRPRILVQGVDRSTCNGGPPPPPPIQGSGCGRRAQAPRLLLSPTILRARRLAYEAAQDTGGSVMARSSAAEEMLV